MVARRTEARAVVPAHAVHLATVRTPPLVARGATPTGLAAALVAATAKGRAARTVDAIRWACGLVARIARPAAIADARGSLDVAPAVTATRRAPPNLARNAGPSGTTHALAIPTDASWRHLARGDGRRHTAVGVACAH